MVSGSQKKKKRRERDSAPIAGPSTSTPTTAPKGLHEHGVASDHIDVDSMIKELAAPGTEPGYMPTFDGPESLPPSLVASLDTDHAEQLLQSVAKDAVSVFTMSGLAKELEGHRAVVQRAYGDERACATLKDFVRANTKVVPLDLWAPIPGEHHVYHLGSANPLTIYYVRCHAPDLSPQTSDPSIIDFGMDAYCPIKHRSAIIRIGEWSSTGLPPEAAEGSTLSPEEKAWSLVAIYTSPIPTPNRIKAMTS
ncbi:hypothetical protein PENSPDRAFT_759474 [Peniophora sp. CONT]|nr:hypothetical protein PENSPDRAFT_759474 [Peniophora sp. CONT]